MPKNFYSKRDKEEDVKKGIEHEMGDKKMFPSVLRIDEGDLEEIKDWQVGEEYEIKLKVKCVKLASKPDWVPSNDSDWNEVHGEFEVVEAECDEEKEEEEESEE